MANTYSWDFGDTSEGDTISSLTFRMYVTSDSETLADGTTYSTCDAGGTVTFDTDKTNVTFAQCKQWALDFIGQTEAEFQADMDAVITLRSNSE